MWKFKPFKTETERDNWITQNSQFYQIDIVYINNGFGVEFKKKLVIDLD